jgi:hypothetical protein
LRYDLYELMKSGCPAVGLVELMLACTSDYQPVAEVWKTRGQ